MNAHFFVNYSDPTDSPSSLINPRLVRVLTILLWIRSSSAHMSLAPGGADAMKSNPPAEYLALWYPNHLT